MMEFLDVDLIIGGRGERGGGKRGKGIERRKEGVRICAEEEEMGFRNCEKGSGRSGGLRRR